MKTEQLEQLMEARAAMGVARVLLTRMATAMTTVIEDQVTAYMKLFPGYDPDDPANRDVARTFLLTLDRQEDQEDQYSYCDHDHDEDCYDYQGFYVCRHQHCLNCGGCRCPGYCDDYQTYNLRPAETGGAAVSE